MKNDQFGSATTNKWLSNVKKFKEIALKFWGIYLTISHILHILQAIQSVKDSQCCTSTEQIQCGSLYCVSECAYIIIWEIGKKSFKCLGHKVD